MKPTLSDFLALLDTTAPNCLAEEWDNPGLQVGSLSQEISKVFVSLDPSYRALVSAARAGAQLLFTHHPLIFRPLSRLDTGSFPGDVAAEAIRRGVSVVAAHTNLDAAEEGINHILAGLLGLERVEVLQENRQIPGSGMGRIGYLARPTEFHRLASDIIKALNLPDMRVAGPGDAMIHRVAVVGGSGAGLLSVAREKGADLLVTGDLGHHGALEAETLGITVVDAGHFHTERAAFMVFADNLQKLTGEKGWELTVEKDTGENDPIRVVSAKQPNVPIEVKI